MHTRLLLERTSSPAVK